MTVRSVPLHSTQNFLMVLSEQSRLECNKTQNLKSGLSMNFSNDVNIATAIHLP